MRKKMEKYINLLMENELVGETTLLNPYLKFEAINPYLKLENLKPLNITTSRQTTEIKETKGLKKHKIFYS